MTRPEKADDEIQKMITVVIATRDRRDQARTCVESVLAQDPPPAEVVVVDNGSSDGTAAALDGRFGGRIRIVREARRGVWHARNRGIDEARGDVVAFIDDDAVAEPGWLAALAACLRETGAAGVGGPALPDWECPPPDYIARSAKALSYMGVFDLGPERRRLGGLRDYLIGTNCAFRRSVFDAGERLQAMGWGRSVGGDDFEFSRRIAARLPVYYEPRAVVRHRIPRRKPRLRGLAGLGFDAGLKKVLIGRGLTPRGVSDLWGVDGWISAFSVAGYSIGRARALLSPLARPQDRSAR